MKRKVITDEDIYKKLLVYIEREYPEIKIEHIDTDYYLYNNMFTSFIPTTFYIYITDEQIDKITESLSSYRVTIDKNSDEYKMYLEKGWFYDFFSGLKKEDKKKSFIYLENELIDRKDI